MVQNQLSMPKIGQSNNLFLSPPPYLSFSFAVCPHQASLLINSTYFFSVKMPKRGVLQGFDGVYGKKTADRLGLWKKNTVEGDWKEWRIEKIRYTRVHRTLRYGLNSFTQTFISPFGAKESVKKRKLDRRVTGSIKSLPNGAVEALGIPPNFDSSDLTIEVDDDGDLGFQEFYVVLCKKCHCTNTGFMNGFVARYQEFLPSSPKLW